MGVNLQQIRLVKATVNDLELLLAWRNDPEIRRYMPSASEISWAQHWEWWVTRDEWRVDWMVWLENTPPRRVDWMVWLENTPPRRVGTVHFNLTSGEIGLIIGEKSLWGQHIGRAALTEALRRSSRWPNTPEAECPTEIWAVVHPENTRSRHLFEGLKFKPAGEGRNGQIHYVWTGSL